MKRRRTKKKRKDDDVDGLSPPERVCSVLRDIQWLSNCSTLALQKVLDSLHDKLGEAVRQCKIRGYKLPLLVTSADKKMRSTVCLFVSLTVPHPQYINHIIIHYQLGWSSTRLSSRMS